MSVSLPEPILPPVPARPGNGAAEGWTQSPPLLLERKQALDGRLQGGYRPTRLILQNFWRFGYQEFHFAQGRLILRGANATGKSTVLVSAITFVLDMERRRERLDTFGGSGRGMAYYLLGNPDATPESDFYHEERTGYVALEFVRGGRYLTVGVGLHSRRNRPDQSVQAWGFAVTDGRRVGKDLQLYDAQKVPLGPRELAEVLGAGGRVEERREAYQALVNRLLFGFDSEQGYQFLLSLLLQLRAPKLNRDTRPSTICEMLTRSLPPLGPELLDQVTRVINEIDACLETVEETSRHLAAVREIDERQAFYLNQLAQLAAAEYLQAYEAHRKAVHALAGARERLGRHREARAQAQADLEANQRGRLAATSELEALEQHEAFEGQRQLQTLQTDLADAQTACRHARKRVEASESRLADLAERGRRLAAEWERVRQQAQARAAEGEAEARDGFWPVAEAGLGKLARALSALRPGEVDLQALMAEVAALREAGSTRLAALARIEAALQEVEKAQGEHDAARSQVEAAEAALSEADREAQRTSQHLDEAREDGVAALEAWAGECRVFSAREAPEAWQVACKGVAAYGPGGGDPARLCAPLIEAGRAQERPLQDAERRLALEKERLQARREQLADELAAWEARTEPEPPRRPEQGRARRLLAEQGIWAEPLYRVCEVGTGLAPEQAARLERTLEAAGLLDALVVPARAAGRVAALLDAEDLGDVWLRPVAAPAGLQDPASGPGGLPAGGGTLADVLTPDGERSADVAAALAGIEWFADPSALLDAPVAARPGSGGLAVAPGAWRAGTACGRLGSEALADGAVRYLGEANRRRFREAEIARLKGELARLDEALWELEDRLMEAQRRLETLRTELGRLSELPAWQALAAAAQELGQARRWLASCREAVEQAERRREQAYGRLQKARAAYQETLADLPEARGRNLGGVRGLAETTRKVLSLAERAGSEARGLAQLDGAVRDHARDFEEAERRLADDREARRQVQEQVERLTARERALRDRLASLDVGIEELTARVRAVRGRLQQLDAERESLVRREAELGKDQEHAEAEVTRLEAEAGRAQAAEAHRRAALADRLQAYPTLDEVWQLFQAAPAAEAEPGPARAARELLRLRRAGEERLLDTVNEGVREAFVALGNAFSQHRSLLLNYRPELAGERVRFFERGEPLAPYQLRAKLQHDLEMNRQVLQQKESELYEEFLLKDVAREIRGRIHLAQEWCERVNDLLAGKRLSNGEVLSVSWKPRPPDRSSATDARRAVELLLRDPETLTDGEVAELVAHFRRRVAEVREGYRQRSLEKSFAEALAEILDYRDWFRFELYSKLPTEPRRELTDLRFASRSGAEKSLAMFIPILTALHAHYQSAAAHAPRLVGIDEAFAGVDEQNVREMFRFLVELDLSWIMTSEKLWGVGEVLPACSTYELLKGENGAIVPVWFLWDGQELLDGLGPVAGGPDGHGNGQA